MKTCIICKKNKNDDEFKSGQIRNSGLPSKNVYVKNKWCNSCNPYANEGLDKDIVNNRAVLIQKTKKYTDEQGNIRFTPNTFNNDYAIDKMTLDYDEFEDIPDITDINKETK